MASRPIRIAILANGSRARAELNQTASTAQRMGAGLRKLRLPALAAAAGLAALGKQSVAAASDAQQSIGATQTIFGKSAEKIIRQSKRAASAYGLSANQYRESSNLIASLLHNQGVAQDRLAGKTRRLVGLGADLAAVYGGQASDAVEALSSAFKGEFDPLERYGISLKQSMINQRALAVANVKTVSSFNKLSVAQQNAAKRQATMALLMKQSTKARGQFAKQTGTLAEQQQILAAHVENLKVKFGRLLIPALTSAAETISKDVLPAVDRFADWLHDNRDQIKSTASSIKNGLVPPLKAVAKVAEGAVKFLAELPGPVKSVGVEAAIAALALRRFSAMAGTMGASMATNVAKVRQLRAEMTYTATRTQRLQAAAGKLSGALRGAAGIGGMLALADSTRRTNGLLGTLEGTAGGAAAGFAVGGPWGAAIGAGAGALVGLVSAVRNANKAAEAMKARWGGLKSTLDSVTGATTAATRAYVYDELVRNKTIQSLKQYGITSRTAVAAVLGQKQASQQVAGVLQHMQGLYDANTAKLGRLKAALKAANTVSGAGYGTASANRTSALEKQIDALEKQARAQKNAMDSIRSGTGVLKRDVAATRAKIKATQDLTGKLKAFPKRVRSKIEAVGITPTLKGVAKVAKQYGATPKKIRTLLQAAGVDGTVKQVQRIIKQTDKVKPAAADASKTLHNMGNVSVSDSWVRSLAGGISRARGIASSGGHSVGDSLGAGVNSGVRAWAGPVAYTTAHMVNEAIGAAKHAALSNSPSRKTMRLGKDMADGLRIGIRKHAKGASKAMRKAVSNATKAARREWEKREQALKRHLDRVQARYKDAVKRSRDYAKQVRATVVGSGDITQMSTPFTPAGVVAGMTDAVAKARRYAALLKRLRKAGLNKTSLRQLLNAGVQGGLATAQALADGIGQGTIKTINNLQRQLTGTGKSLGNAMSKAFYAAGTRAAAALVRAVKRKLKIHSPSKVFQELGQRSVQGLRIGLDATYARRSGEVLASSLVKGFAHPQLSATAALAERDRGAAATGRTYQVNVSVPVTASPVQVGRSIVSAIDAYERAGGRKRR